MKKTYYGYIRVSTKKQGNGASLGEQQAAIEAFAERNGLAVVKWFCETTTAAKEGRQQFAEMLRELQRGKASGVIIHRIDRSARNLKDWARIGDLMDAGVEVHFAHEALDLATRGGRLSADIQAVVAADFIRSNREAVKLCMHGWVKKGHYPWPAPIGYLNQGKHRLKAIDPVRGPLVARAFALYANGEHSLETLGEELARTGLTTSKGRALSRSTLSTILRNPFYVGIIHLRKSGAHFPGKHSPLVSASVFERVQQMLGGRAFPREVQAEFRFRRLIKCAECPRTLTGERQKGQTYYRCHTSQCAGLCFNEEMIDQSQVIPALRQLHFDPEALVDLKSLVQARMELENDSEATRFAMADRDLAAIADRLQRLTDALLDGVIDNETYNERKGQLLQRRARLEEAKTKGANTHYWADVLSRFELGSTALNQYLCAEDAEKRSILNSLGSNFRADPNGVVFTMDFPFSEVMKWRGVLDSAPVRAHVRTPSQGKAKIERLIKSIDESQVPEVPDVPMS